jgi:isopentenyldiphosphate isomerase
VAELWDIYDANGEKTGKLHERGKPMGEGDHHLVVNVWIINAKGEFLISRRAETKTYDDMALKWQTTGGCAVAGDGSLATALKETREEIGIELDPANGQLYKRIIARHVENDSKGTMINDVWVFRQDVDINEVVLCPEETCGAMYVSEKRLREMVDLGEFVAAWYLYMEEFLQWFFR